MSSNTKNDESLFVICMIVFGAIALWVYFQVKAFAEWVGLDMHAVWSLLSGVISLAIIFGASLWLELRLTKLLPYAPCAFFPFVIPALDYWSVNHATLRFSMDSAEAAWYGTWWGQIALFLILAALGYFVSKWFDDNY